MTTLILFDSNDLEKFSKVVSYNFREKYPSIFNEKADTTSSKEDLTHVINSMKLSDSDNLRNDIFDQIKSKEKSILELQLQVVALKEIKDKIGSIYNFKEQFEIITGNKKATN